jgi:nucleotide-binding universal stress UspA family protein
MDPETIVERRGGADTTPSRQQILYPIFDTYSDQTFEIALDLADGSDAELILLDLVDDVSAVLDESRAIGSELLDAHLDPAHDVDATVLLEENEAPIQTVTTFARSHDIDLLVVDEYAPTSFMDLFRGDVSDRIGGQVSCDSVTVSHRQDEHRIGSILVPLSEEPHSELAVVIAGALARSANAVVELFHVSEQVDAEAQARANRLFEEAFERLPEDIDVDTWHLKEPDIAAAIVEQSRYYDVTVLGKSKIGRLQKLITESIPDEVSDDAENIVLTARKGDGLGFQV